MIKNVLIDTDILSYFFKGNKIVRDNFNYYLNHDKTLFISIITYYEILSGLYYNDSLKKLTIFENFIQFCNILPLTEKSIKISASIYSSLRKEGNPLDDIDILIAGVAISENFILITNNEKHFNRIIGLDIENWSIVKNK